MDDNSNGVPPPVSTNQGTMTVSDIIHECNDAVAKLSRNHPHKRLIFNCAIALRQLVDRLAVYEDQGDGTEDEDLEVDLDDDEEIH